MDGLSVALDAFGKRAAAAHNAAQARPQRAKEAFGVVGFSFGFATEAVRALGKGRAVSIPEVAAGGAAAIILGKRLAQKEGG